MKLAGKITLVSLCLFWVMQLKAQQVGTMYFMENVPVRHILNPAFQPDYDFYLSLPVLGFTQAGVGNNSLALKDVVYKSDNQTVWFLNSQAGVDRLYGRLWQNTIFSADVQTNLLGFGFRKNSGFWTFVASEKGTAMLGLPKDLFKLLLYGTPEIQSNRYSFTKLQAGLSVYTEFALGYSRKWDKKWMFGAKLKYLWGSVDINNSNERINLQAGIDNWNLQGQGSVRYSSPVALSISSDLQTISYTKPVAFSEWLKPSGMGAGLDVGATYNFNPYLAFSASIIDLGFIVWKRNLQSLNYKADFSFDGLAHFGNDATIQSIHDKIDWVTSGSHVVDSLADVLDKSFTTDLKPVVYTTVTPVRINLGAEYKLLDNQMSLGLLSQSRFQKKTVDQELSFLVNARPRKWFNACVSTSLFKGRLSSVGAGIGLKLGPVHLQMATDYLPFEKVTAELPLSGQNQNVPILYSTTCFNFSAGLNLVFLNADNKLREQKVRNASRLGLRNRSQTIPSDPKFNVPNPFKKKPHKLTAPKKHPSIKKSRNNCRCDWN